MAIGQSFQNEGQYSLAIAEFDKLTGNGLDTELAQQAFFLRGQCYAAAGKRDRTLADFTEKDEKAFSPKGFIALQVHAVGKLTDTVDQTRWQGTESAL